MWICFLVLFLNPVNISAYFSLSVKATLNILRYNLGPDLANLKIAKLKSMWSKAEILHDYMK